MEIVVCIKQVPDTTEVKIDPVKNTLIRDGVPSIVNPFDEYAMEAAVRIKEQCGAKITVLTMGPPQAASALRKCLAMGADEAVLVSDRAVAGADTLATSFTLAKAIEKIGKPDIIFCGKMAIDGDTAQVGPGIAEHLGLPQTTYVQKIREVSPHRLIVERVSDSGHELVSIPLPCVVTVDKAIGEPRYPSVKGSINASRQEIITWTAADIEAPPDKTGLNGSCTQVMRIFTPQIQKHNEMLSAESDEALCDLLLAKLQEAKIV